ncbi:hypothetical protein SJI00_21220 [Pseudomonas sp. RP23018S]|uniref:hypothetical protein n=1 Tax=Pseudomonas sp. RP23018S TaxID=3096037 RepID=UPI002ACADFAF|nr:hypothetical protein [Pseudomonas sp. RP23018S]MDZ5605299.1 hypothetical protein [Pseudomonas sp. RP23018S]
MSVPTIESHPNAERAKALITRLEQLNQTVKESTASAQLIDVTLKIGVTYAAFLIEVRDRNTALDAVDVPEMLNRTEEHCRIYEVQFPSIAKGVGA